MVPRVAVVAVCCCLLLTTPLAVATVGATQHSGGTSETETTAGSVERCFPDDGYEFTIGTQGPQIGMILHLSMLTNLGGPGAVGVELTGSVGGPPIIELKTGILFGGVDGVLEFLNDPFGAFSVAFDYQFSLPMLGGDFSYDESDVPVDGPINDANCSF